MSHEHVDVEAVRSEAARAFTEAMGERTDTIKPEGCFVVVRGMVAPWNKGNGGHMLHVMRQDVRDGTAQGLVIRPHCLGCATRLMLGVQALGGLAFFYMGPDGSGADARFVYIPVNLDEDPIRLLEDLGELPTGHGVTWADLKVIHAGRPLEYILARCAATDDPAVEAAAYTAVLDALEDRSPLPDN